jgi:hypothetical protein
VPVSRRAQWMRAEADSSTHCKLGKTTEAFIFNMPHEVTIRRKIRQDMKNCEEMIRRGYSRQD